MLLSRNAALLLNYDGTQYTGWTGVRDTVLRPTLGRILGQEQNPPLVIAASRTDAGVHAAGQVCTFPLPQDADTSDAGQLRYSLNQLLPPAVAVRQLAFVDDDSFDPRDTVEKTYRYHLSTASCRDPLRRLYEWQRPPRRGQPEWDAAAVRAAARHLQGTHSFAAFGNRPRGRERNVEVDPVCCVHELSLTPQSGEDEEDTTTSWTFTVRGDRFLYKMVRNIVGALVRVGSGELDEAELEEAVRVGAFTRSRSMALTAPAHGLVLQKIEYGSSDPFTEI